MVDNALADRTRAKSTGDLFVSRSKRTAADQGLCDGDVPGLRRRGFVDQPPSDHVVVGAPQANELISRRCIVWRYTAARVVRPAPPCTKPVPKTLFCHTKSTNSFLIEIIPAGAGGPAIAFPVHGTGSTHLRSHRHRYRWRPCVWSSTRCFRTVGGRTPAAQRRWTERTGRWL